MSMPNAPLIRFVFAIVFWIASFNATGISFFHWWMGQALSVQILAGVIWAAVAGIMCAWSYEAIGKWGVMIVAALLGALGFFFYDIGLVTQLSGDLLSNLVPLCLGLVNGVALNWNDLRRKGSGAVAVDEGEIE